MNKRKSHIDLIEKYLANSLTPDEVDLFSKKLDSDEEFVKELNDTDRLIIGIKKAAARTTIEEKLDRLDKSMRISEEGNGSRIFFPRYENIKKYNTSIAAILALIVVTTITLFNLNQTPHHLKLYAEFYRPFENNFGNTRGPEKTEQNYWRRALAYYDAGFYDSALANFDHIQSSEFNRDFNSPSLNLYKGNSLMQLNRHKEAIPIFQNMIANEEGLVIQAKWYLSMCYLFEDNQEKCLALLSEIAGLKASSYSQKAQKVLDQMK